MAKKTERHENDYYPTPDGVALAICKRLKEILPDVREIVEPSAGSGAFVRAARATWPDLPILAVEIDENMRQACLDAGATAFTCMDWPLFASDGFNPGTLVTGNPPFSLAIPHVLAGLRNLNEGDHLAFLLRMSINGSVGRLQFWRDNPAKYEVPLVPRPSFTKGGSDNSEYGLFVWQAGFKGLTTKLPHLVWR